MNIDLPPTVQSFTTTIAFDGLIKPRHMDTSAFLSRKYAERESELGHMIASHFGWKKWEYLPDSPGIQSVDVVVMTPEYYKQLKQKAQAYDHIREDLR